MYWHEFGRERMDEEMSMFCPGFGWLVVGFGDDDTCW
jgi:hypothetical protein